MITQKELKSQLHYDQKTGIFIWKSNNKIAGYTKENGYKFIRLNYKLYRSHHLAWLYVNNEFPKDEIDHIDGNPSNNSINNLRLSNSSQNKWNTRKRKDNTSGVKGLHWYKAYNKWQVYINANKKRISLGYFNDFFEACCAIYSERNKLHGEFKNYGNVL